MPAPDLQPPVPPEFRAVPSPQPQAERPSELPPAIALLQMGLGRWISMMVSAAAKLGIADLLRDGPKPCEELARETQTHPRALYRLLRALASLGVFAEADSQHFSLTPLGEHLRSDTPNSLRWAVIFMNTDWQLRAWEQLLYSVRTGRSAFEHVYGMKGSEYLARNPEAAEIFNKAMTNLSGLNHNAIIEAYDFSGVRKLADLGGGRGHLLAAILKANPGLHGILFDQPHVIAAAREEAAEVGLDERCEFLSGDLLTSIPAGADAYLMKHIIHGTDDEAARRVLHNCRAAMAPDARLLVIECVIPPGSEPSYGKLLDIEMLVMPGGMERSEEEYRQLFAAAGLRLNRVVSTKSPLSILEAVAG